MLALKAHNHAAIEYVGMDSGDGFLRELREDVSSLSESSSDITESANTTLDAKMRKTNKKSLKVTIKDDESEKLSVTSNEKKEHNMRHTRYIEDLFSKTKQFTEQISVKARSIKMVGKSLYDFPALNVLQERNEKQVMSDFEKETNKILGTGAQFGLAMMTHEKTEHVIEEEDEEQEINDHVQFLTNDMKTQTGGESAIFKKDPLNKKPGANYTFDELCEIESQVMQDNSSEFEKRILYQMINKVANMPLVEEQKAGHPEYIYFMECSKDTDTPLPILSHIFNHTLTLANYTLSSGHC